MNFQTSLLPLPPGCLEGRFLRRSKRFSVLCDLNGREVWAHTNNTGAMLGLLRPQAPVLLSPAAGSSRKLPYTLEGVWVNAGAGGFWACVNTLAPNRLLAAAFRSGRLPFAKGYTVLKTEARCGVSRLDACLTGPRLPTLWVECKNVTLAEDGVAAFPDAKSERGARHLLSLMDMVASGQRGAMFYAVQRHDCECFGPADYIDADYAALFWQAMAQGVEIYPYRCVMTERGLDLGELLPVARP